MPQAGSRKNPIPQNHRGKVSKGQIVSNMGKKSFHQLKGDNYE